jgi:UDP-N-acetylglucosamine 2-epimerase (non-hydrolysing)
VQSDPLGTAVTVVSAACRDATGNGPGLRIVSVVGGRPNFIKIAPLLEAMEKVPLIQPLLVHTGQHYDHEMSRAFFEELEIPEPDFFLGVGSGSHAQQTAKVMVEFERVLEESRPDLVVVVGDLNSTLACALVAAKRRVPVAHVEAGLRSFDRSMPEEINRILTDHVSDYLFTPSEDADAHLLREGISAARIHRAGNVMIDTLRKYEPAGRARQAARPLGLAPREYAVLTLHRPSNVDEPEMFGRMLDGVEAILDRCPVVFPVHPRTRKRLAEFGMEGRLRRLENLRLCAPLGYLAFLSLLMDSRFVMTDSGGIQEETTALGVPCLTLRENTERPITASLGTNRVIGTQPARIAAEARRLLDGDLPAGTLPPLWDGRAAGRIVEVLRRHGARREVQP